MMKFSQFLKLTESEEERDIVKTLSRLPSSHAALVQGFQWKFHPGNTLNGDQQHVGYIDDRQKVIAVASPWNYGREFTVLHEVAHKVWEKFVAPNPELVRKWRSLCQKKTQKQMKDNSLSQDPEELFCMSYSQRYCKNKIEKFDNPYWLQFIDSIPQ